MCPNLGNETHAYAQMHMHRRAHTHTHARTHRANNITENLEAIKYEMAEFFF